MRLPKVTATWATPPDAVKLGQRNSERSRSVAHEAPCMRRQHREMLETPAAAILTARGLLPPRPLG